MIAYSAKKYTLFEQFIIKYVNTFRPLMAEYAVDCQYIFFTNMLLRLCLYRNHTSPILIYQIYNISLRKHKIIGIIKWPLVCITKSIKFIILRIIVLCMHSPIFDE